MKPAFVYIAKKRCGGTVVRVDWDGEVDEKGVGYLRAFVTVNEGGERLT